MKSKREIELEKCLEKTLRELQARATLHARLARTVNHYFLFTSKQYHKIVHDIQRTLKGGDHEGK